MANNWMKEFYQANTKPVPAKKHFKDKMDGEFIKYRKEAYKDGNKHKKAFVARRSNYQFGSFKNLKEGEYGQ